MRNFKRFLAMALTMLMLVSSLSLITSAKFEDVTDFQNEIAVLSNLGVIKGKADGTYGFDEAVTRRQTALFFARATTGKVDDAIHWQSEVNTTPFKDLDAENDFYGAISYCHNVGIVLGRSATEFAPNDNITFQEAVTMAVRALGYGGASMDAGYPWTYYSKAVSLGLDKGIEDVGLDDVVSRGVMAKLIYNAMFATNSKGSTIAADAFGSAVKTTNLVLVATKGKTLVANLSTNASDKVAAFVEFNSDGTLNLDKVYHFNWADFAEMAYGEGAEEKAADHVGYSYNVVTVDNFKSLVTVSENPSKTFTSADYVGDGKFEDNEYTLVQKWSSVFNIGTTASGKEELIQYNTAYSAGVTKIGAGKAYYAGHWYVVDAKSNILDVNGKVLLYFYDNVKDKIVSGATTTFPFYYELGGKYYPAYLPVDGSRYSGAATLDQYEVDNTPYTYAVDKIDKKYTSNVSAYADTVVYDDNNDGVYDRAYFTAYVFGKLKVQDDDTGDGKLDYYFHIGANGGKKYNVRGADKVINLTDVELKKDTTYYVLWAYDAVNETVTVKKVYDEVKYGYVVAVDVVNDTITFANNSWFGIGVGNLETIKYGVSKLPGATNTNNDLSIKDNGDGELKTEALVGVNYTLLNKYVSYIVDEENDGRIIAVLGAKDAKTPLVVTSVVTPYNIGGNIRASVIDNTGKAQIITISRINDIPAVSYFLNFLSEDPPIKAGDVILGAKQDDGTWMVTVTTDQELSSVDAKTVLTFINGYGYDEEGNLFIKHDDSRLVIVVAYIDNGEIKYYEVATGIPAKDAELIIKKNDKYYIEDDNKGFLYIKTKDTKSKFGTGWNFTKVYTTGAVSDVYYISSVNSFSGNTYYVNYLSIINANSGSAVVYNATGDKIEKGKFYEVTKITQGNTTEIYISKEADMEEGKILSAFTKYSFTVDGDVEYVGKEVKVYDWTSSTKNFDKEISSSSLKSDKIYKVTYYKNVGAISGGKVVLLVTDIIDKDKAYKLTVDDVKVPVNNKKVVRVYTTIEDLDGIEITLDDLTFEVIEVIYYDTDGEKLYEGDASAAVFAEQNGKKYIRISNFEAFGETEDGDPYPIELAGPYRVKITLTCKDDDGKTSNPVTVGPVLLNFAEVPGGGS